MTKVAARRNKHRGAQDERESARIIGGQRHKADTGGPEDIKHPHFAIQHKGGKSVVTQAMREALVSARLAALGTAKLPAVMLTDRRGTRVQRWICFPLQEFADEHGYGEESDD